MTPSLKRLFSNKKITTLLDFYNFSDSMTVRAKRARKFSKDQLSAPEINVFRRKCYLKAGFGPHDICQVCPMKAPALAGPVLHPTGPPDYPKCGPQGPQNTPLKINL